MECQSVHRRLDSDTVIIEYITLDAPKIPLGLPDDPAAEPQSKYNAAEILAKFTKEHDGIVRN